MNKEKTRLVMFIILVSLVTTSFVADSKKQGKEFEKIYLAENNQEDKGFKFPYVRWAKTKCNFEDFSWKFLEEYEESGYFVLIGNENKLILENAKGERELFQINRFQKFESGYMGFTDKKNIIIFSVEYNRIAIGKENSDLFGMFIFLDKDKEKISLELTKLKS